MKSCPKCNYPNPDDRADCFKCGEKLYNAKNPYLVAKYVIASLISVTFFIFIVIVVPEAWPGALLGVICTIILARYIYYVQIVIAKRNDILADTKRRIQQQVDALVAQGIVRYIPMAAMVT